MRRPQPPSPVVAAALLELTSTSTVGLRVFGTCMEPALADGSCVEVSPSRVYLPGDVIAYRSVAGALRVHRVLGAIPGWGGLRLVTRGDRAPVADGAIPLSAVLGKVTAVLGEETPFRVPLTRRLWALARFIQLLTHRAYTYLFPEGSEGTRR